MQAIRELEAMVSAQEAQRGRPAPQLSIVPEQERCSVLAIGLSGPARAALRALEFCELTESTTVADAVQLARLHRYQAVFVDSEVQGLSPTDLDQLRAAAPHTPKALVGRLAQSTGLDAFPWSAEFSFLPLEGGATTSFRDAVFALVHPRSSERVARHQDGHRVTGMIDDRGFDLPLLDLSNRGLSFGVRQGELLDGFLPGTKISNLQVADRARRLQLGPIHATVRHCRTERTESGPVVRVGISFDAPLQAQVPHQRVLRDAVPILSAIRKASRAAAAFTVAIPNEETSYRFATSRIEDGEKPVLVLTGAVPSELGLHDAVCVSFSHHGQSYSAISSIIGLDEGLRIAMPRSMAVQHRRGTNRHKPAAGRVYQVALSSSLTELNETFVVDDINTTGLSIIVDLNDHVFPTGLVLDPIEIAPPDGKEAFLARGVVRSVTPLARRPEDGNRRPARVGIEILQLAELSRNRLNQNLLMDGFPHVEPGRVEDFEGVWSFLQEAGFVAHLYNGADAEKLQAVKDGYARMLGAAHPLGAHLVFRDDGKIRGHITAMRLYSKTILATHLAALQGKAAGADRISRALCMSLSEYTEQQESAEFAKLIWNRDLAWPNRMFGWSGRAIHQHGLSEARDFAILIRPNGAPAPAAVDGVTLQNPTEAELLKIERYFLENVSLVRVQSEDLTLSGLRLGIVSNEYRRCGLRRERQVRVARVDGQMAGFSLLERSTQAIQLSEVTNGFDVFELPDAPETARKMARAALVGDAVRFYTDEGLFHSVALSDNPDTAPFLDAGFKVAVHAKSWTLHYTQMRTWIDAWDQLFQNGRAIFGGRPG